jgi:pSer/pThr/pTyr-binding forkhead associated (FHA) protein
MATLRLVPATGNPIEITQASVLVGRDPACDVVLADGSVSRRHARLEQREDAWFVVDQGSANGTFLDSVRATDTPIHGGQELRFGAVSFRLEISGGEVGATVVTDVGPFPTVMQAPSPTVPTHAATPGVGPVRTIAPPPPPSVRPVGARPPGLSAPFVPKPVKKGRGPGFWVGLGCCGCLSVAVLAVGGFFVGLRAMTGPAAELVQQHLESLRRGDHAAAWAQLSPSLQAELTLETFEALVAAHPTLGSNSAATLTDRSWSNSVVTLRYTLTATTGEQERISYRLVKEGDAWRIVSIQIAEPEP